jgi:hypothetical protein
MVGFKVLFYQGPRDLEHYSFEPNEFIISFGWWFKHSELQELIVQNIKFKLGKSSNGYALMGFWWSMWGWGRTVWLRSRRSRVLFTWTTKFTISFGCWFEPSEVRELVVQLVATREVNLDNHLMFFHWCYFFYQFDKFRVLFYQGPRNLKLYSLELNEHTISSSYWPKPNEPNELVLQHTNLEMFLHWCYIVDRCGV